MDISTVFKSCIKTVALYDIEDSSNIKSNIYQKHSLFFMKVQMITNNITILHNLLMKSRITCLNFSNHFSNKIMVIDIDQNKINSITQNVYRSLKLINDLKEEIKVSQISQQNQEHREIIVSVIEEYLKNAYKIYSEQKAMCIKKAIKQSRIIKNDTLGKHNEINLQNNLFQLNEINSFEINKYVQNEENPLNIQELNGDMNGIFCCENEQLSPEDFQILETENEQLFNDLNLLTVEIKQVENKVVHISELQEIFTKKVLDQDKNLESVLTTVIGSTENVNKANEQIRKAIQRNAGLRAWVLFFLLIMSFSLIFLDWYNS